MHVVPGVFAIGIGAFALFALKGSREQRSEMLAWPSVPGRITDRTIERRPASIKRAGYSYFPAFRYAYSVEGVEHTGDTRNLNWSSGSTRWMARRKLDKTPDTHPVLYDPADPSKSALEPPARSDVWVWGVAGVGLIALGVVLFIT